MVRFSTRRVNVYKKHFQLHCLRSLFSHCAIFQAENTLSLSDKNIFIYVHTGSKDEKNLLITWLK